VEGAPPAAENEFGHDDVHDGIRIGSQLSDRLEEWLADIAVGRLVDVERQRTALDSPCMAEPLPLCWVDGEEHCTGVIDL